MHRATSYIILIKGELNIYFWLKLENLTGQNTIKNNSILKSIFKVKVNYNLYLRYYIIMYHISLYNKILSIKLELIYIIKLVYDTISFLIFIICTRQIWLDLNWINLHLKFKIAIFVITKQDSYLFGDQVDIIF